MQLIVLPGYIYIRYVFLEILKRVESLIYFPSCSWYKQGFNAGDLFLSYKYTL